MDKKINFAVIGCGMLARSQHIPNIARSPRMTLHTCCDLSDDALRECKEKYNCLHITKDYKQAIKNPDVDVLCVATAQTLRKEIIQQAAENNKPIYVEKPIANGIEELYQIEQIIKDSGIPFCAGHNRRSSLAMIDAYRIFRSHMDNPKLCPWRYEREPEKRPQFANDGVAAMSVRINDDWYSWKNWVFDEEVAIYGPMLFEMTHFTDLCNYFLKAEPMEVVSIESSFFSSGTIIKYKTGEIATMLMCANGTFGYPKELYEMFGNGAAVIVDHMLEVRTSGIEDAPYCKKYPMLNDRHTHIGTEAGLAGWLTKKRAACKEAVENNDTKMIFTAEPDKGHARALERFVDEIYTDGPVVCGIDDAVMATRVAFAAIKAAKEHRIVKINEI